jgi:hypothetical protein
MLQEIIQQAAELKAKRQVGKKKSRGKAAKTPRRQAKQ